MLTPTDLLAQLRWRYATKQFDPAKVIPAATWQALEEALILSPSSFGLQPWRFTIVSDPALKAALRPVSWNQSQITDCSHLVVFTMQKDLGEADIDRFIALTASTRNSPIESLAGYRGMMVNHLTKGPMSRMINEWATRQVYIALGNFMTSCALLGVDSCPLEGIDPGQYDAVLGLTSHATVVACAAGYRAAGDKYASAPKVRYPASAMLDRR